MVVIAAGPHLFPSRTQKLSPLTPMVLHGQLCGRVGSRRRKSLLFFPTNALGRGRLRRPVVSSEL